MGSKEQEEHDHGVASVCASGKHMTGSLNDGDVAKAWGVVLECLRQQHPDIGEHPENYQFYIDVHHGKTIAHPEGACERCDEWRARDRALLAEHGEGP